MTHTRPWFWVLFPAVAMSLGWGLRGHIGGGSLGAMIPGAMIGLALCLLLNRHRDAGLIAAFAAVGVGFGGQETYGQTVHISMLPGQWGWGMTGFTIKGAVWGLLGGAAIGIAFMRERLRSADILAGLALMVAGTWAGWKLINQPKLVYFSYLHEKPREELWAGLLLGGVLLLAWLWLRDSSAARMPLRFALWGTLGGGLGFGLGAAIHIWGRMNVPDFPFGWWKTMEFTFGALLGGAFGYCAWFYRNELQPAPEPEPPMPVLPSIGAAVLGVIVGVISEFVLPVRFDYTVAGSVLLAIALFWRSFAWQTAVSVTVFAFLLDLHDNRPDLPHLALWSLILAGTLSTIVFVARRPRVLSAFLLVTIAGVVDALMKDLLLPPRTPGVLTWTMEGTFVVLGVVTVFWARKLKRPAERGAAAVSG